MKMRLDARYTSMAHRIGYGEEFENSVNKLTAKAEENGEEVELLQFAVGDGRVVALFCISKKEAPDKVAKKSGGKSGSRTKRPKADGEQPEAQEG